MVLSLLLHCSFPNQRHRCDRAATEKKVELFICCVELVLLLKGFWPITARYNAAQLQNETANFACIEFFFAAQLNFRGPAQQHDQT